MGITSSTISQRWRLCILASLVGCISFILFLKYGLQNVSISTLETAAVLPPPDIHELITTVVEDEESGATEEKKEEKKCDIFDGRWVYDPKGNPLYDSSQCPFLSEKVSCQKNGRPDFEYEKWSWEADGCQIPRFDGKEMLERIRGKRVIIVGDSLNRNQWESLACLLYSSVHPSRAHVDVQSSVYKVFRAMDFECSVEFYWSPFLVQYEGKAVQGRRILKLDEVAESAQRWKGANVMVFNTGHWWVHTGKLKAWDFFQYEGKLAENMEIEKAFGLGMKTWANWIDQNVDANKTKVFFRSISPDHKGEQWCYNRTQPITHEDSYKSTTFPKPILEIVERTIREMKTPIHYLNITKLSDYRTDGHPSVFARKEVEMKNLQKDLKYAADCSHWCLPGVPDTWNRLLYASMVSNNSSGYSFVDDKSDLVL